MAIDDYWRAVDLVDRFDRQVARSLDVPPETVASVRTRAREIAAGDRSAETVFCLAHTAALLVARLAAALSVSTEDVLEGIRGLMLDGTADDVERELSR